MQPCGSQNNAQPHVYHDCDPRVSGFQQTMIPPTLTAIPAVDAPNQLPVDSISQAVIEVIEVVKPPVDFKADQEPVEYTGEYGQIIKELTNDILSCTSKLKSIIGGNLFIVSGGNAPFIPDTYMARQDYADRSNELMERVKQAEAEYVILTKLPPNECPLYGEFVFGVGSSVCIPENISKAAEKVKTTRKNFRYFLDNRVSVDLKALRSEVLGLHETVTMAKHRLRSFQFVGVDIGTSIFPNRGAVACEGPIYTPTRG